MENLKKCKASLDGECLLYPGMDCESASLICENKFKEVVNKKTIDDEVDDVDSSY